MRKPTEEIRQEVAAVSGRVKARQDHAREITRRALTAAAKLMAAHGLEVEDCPLRGTCSHCERASGHDQEK
jgi:hypothetical protein